MDMTLDTLTGTTERDLRTNGMPCLVIDPLTDDRWDAFVQQHPAALAFHTSAWCRVLVDAYGYQPRYHVLLDDDGHITAALPLMFVSSRLTGRRLVSLPFCDHCHPLVTTADEAELLVDAAIADAQELGAARIELRGWPNASVAVPSRLTPEHHYNRYEIALDPDPEALFRRFGETARRYVRQAGRKGVRVRLADGPGDLRSVYALNVLLRKRHGMLTQPFAFFRAIEEHLIAPGHGYIMLAEVDERPIAALLCLTFRDTVMDKFAMSDPAYWDLRPNHALFWASLERSCHEGFRRFDMGRCGREDVGLARFKEQWSAERIPIPYYYHPRPGGPNVQQPAGLKKRGLELFARYAPHHVFVSVGAALYRHLG